MDCNYSEIPSAALHKGVTVQTGAQGELALDYKLNRGIKDCTVQGRIKTFFSMISILVNVFPSLTESLTLYSKNYLLHNLSVILGLT